MYYTHVCVCIYTCTYRGEVYASTTASISLSLSLSSSHYSLSNSFPYLSSSSFCFVFLLYFLLFIYCFSYYYFFFIRYILIPYHAVLVVNRTFMLIVCVCVFMCFVADFIYRIQTRSCII